MVSNPMSKMSTLPFNRYFLRRGKSPLTKLKFSFNLAVVLVVELKICLHIIFLLNNTISILITECECRKCDREVHIRSPPEKSSFFLKSWAKLQAELWNYLVPYWHRQEFLPPP